MIFFVVIVISCTLISVCQSDPVGLPVHHSGGSDISTKQQDKQLTERELRLEDFFWSGSGDGPPQYLKKVHTSATNGKEVIIKTETIVATVYVEGNNEADPLCLDCINGSNGLPLNYTTDRRYWLLTVVAGFFRPRDFPMLEGNLAKLYRIAFTRQQSFHLGISDHLSDSHNDTVRSKRFTKENGKEKNKENEYENRRFRRIIKRSLPPDIEIDPEPDLEQTTEKNKEKFLTAAENRSPNEQDIKIIIHNVTLISEDDIQNWESNYDDVNDQRNLRPLANQTEIIYSVFVDGTPILATTAAQDMKLVSQNEVTTIMGKDIYMKAEPYLKEPQATPLVPAGKNGTLSIYNVFTHNPVMIAVTSFTILLLILLLVALLLMTRAKRERSAEVKRLSSRQGLLSNRTGATDLPTNRTVTDVATSRTDLEDGVENHGFVYDQSTNRKNENRNRDYPSIDFPMPPVSRPSSTSTTGTSDSSVYCPVNKPNQDLQNMLDEKANKLFEKKKKGSRTEMHEKSEQIYSAIGKKRKQKIKRKYLAENRVGSIEETVQIHSSQTSISTDSISESLKPDYDHFEHNEAYNPNTNYHRNKILENRVFSDKIYDTVANPCTSPTQAINREIIKVLRHGGEKSSESGSIGSFLSMASVKSFPRHQLPEPLHRVLEPVSVTHYDYYDQACGPIKKPRNTKTVTLGDMPKQIQSDNPDPGVIGPIVWEIHKKRMSNKNESLDSPVRDPASTRDRFEGLLEGAIQLYTTTGASPKRTPKKLAYKSTGGVGGGNVRLKDNRGKSAIIPNSRLSRSNSEVRPVTAGPTKSHSNSSTQPPSPNGRAWGSGAPSPLVRPLSAGPFHRPEAPIVDVTRVLAHQSTDRTQLSAAPLIEAIQNELKKFKRENSK